MSLLVDGLQSAVEGGRLLSRAVLEAVGWRLQPCGCPSGRGQEPGLWTRPDGSYHFDPLPDVSENAEAARALLPARVSVSAEKKTDGPWMIILRDQEAGEPVRAHGATLALALCAAAVRLTDSAASSPRRA